MKIGFHTDAFNSAYWSFDKCLEWTQRNSVRYTECGLIDGVSWIHGLGYFTTNPDAMAEMLAWLRKTLGELGIGVES